MPCYCAATSPNLCHDACLTGQKAKVIVRKYERFAIFGFTAQADAVRISVCCNSSDCVRTVTYDAYALILGDKKVAPFQYCRIGTDVLCVLVGMLCGAWPGIGTLITAFFMGPIIVWFNIHFSRPLLQGRLWKRG